MKKNKIISLLLVVVFGVFCLPLSAWAMEDDAQIELDVIELSPEQYEIEFEKILKARAFKKMFSADLPVSADYVDDFEYAVDEYTRFVADAATLPVAVGVAVKNRLQSLLSSGTTTTVSGVDYVNFFGKRLIYYSDADLFEFWSATVSGFQSPSSADDVTITVTRSGAGISTTLTQTIQLYDTIAYFTNSVNYLTSYSPFSYESVFDVTCLSLLTSSISLYFAPAKFAGLPVVSVGGHNPVGNTYSGIYGITSFFTNSVLRSAEFNRQFVNQGGNSAVSYPAQNYVVNSFPSSGNSITVNNANNYAGVGVAGGALVFDDDAFLANFNNVVIPAILNNYAGVYSSMPLQLNANFNSYTGGFGNPFLQSEQPTEPTEPPPTYPPTTQPTEPTEPPPTYPIETLPPATYPPLEIPDATAKYTLDMVQVESAMNGVEQYLPDTAEVKSSFWLLHTAVDVLEPYKKYIAFAFVCGVLSFLLWA